MRVFLVGALVLSSLISSSAQTPFSDPYLYPNPPWCPTCFIVGALDTPQSNNRALLHLKAARLQYGQWYVGGWAFVCEGGGIPTRYEVAYRDDGGAVITVPQTYVVNYLPRQDVQDALSPGCPGAPSYAGFHIYFTSSNVPRGTRDFYVRIWRDGLLHARHVVVTVD